MTYFANNLFDSHEARGANAVRSEELKKIETGSEESQSASGRGADRATLIQRRRVYGSGGPASNLRFASS